MSHVQSLVEGEAPAAPHPAGQTACDGPAGGSDAGVPALEPREGEPATRFAQRLVGLGFLVVDGVLRVAAVASGDEHVNTWLAAHRPAASGGPGGVVLPRSGYHTPCGGAREVRMPRRRAASSSRSDSRTGR